MMFFRIVSYEKLLELQGSGLLGPLIQTQLPLPAAGVFPTSVKTESFEHNNLFPPASAEEGIGKFESTTSSNEAGHVPVAGNEYLKVYREGLDKLVKPDTIAVLPEFAFIVHPAGPETRLQLPKVFGLPLN
jgi:hypothetical protein